MRHDVIIWILHPTKMTSKKLLVLDVNGLLVDTYFYKEPLPEESPDARVGSFYVYKRPFCEEFLQFCLENFTVGIWSSAREHNVNNLVDYVFGGMKEKLAFSWHQSDCTDLGLKSPDNQWKPLFLKELSKLWMRVKVDLPWSEDQYGSSNTLLVDDTPYKAILNPPNTAIFPRSYTARDRGDNFLGGALRSYLEGIRDAASVQTYVESNPFGEPSISPASPLWSYVNEVLLKVKNVLNKVEDDVAQIMPAEAVSDEGNKEGKPERWQNGKWKQHLDPLQPVEAATDEKNEEGKHKQWRNRKPKYYSDPLHLASNHLQSSDSKFPSEAHSSDHMLQPLGGDMNMYDSTAHQQVHELTNLGSQEMVNIPLDQTYPVCSLPNQPFRQQERPSQAGRGTSLPSSLEDLSKDAYLDSSTLSIELGIREEHRENTGFVLSLEQGHQGALEAAKQAASMQEDLKRIEKEHGFENQASKDDTCRPFDKQGHFEGPFVRVTDAGVDAELDRLHEQHCDDADENIRGEGNESSERSCMPVCNDSLMSSKPYCRQVETNNQESFCGRWETRNNNFVHASNNNYASQQHLTHSNRLWHKQRGTWENVNKWHNPRNDSNRGSFSCGQGWKSKGRYHKRDRTQMPCSGDLDQREHHFTNNQHTKNVDRHNSGKGHQNRFKPFCGSARHFHQRQGDGPLAQLAGRATKYNENGRRDQDGGPSSYLQHRGFEQGAVRERSNMWPGRTELNVNVHDLASNPPAVEAEARGNWKRQRLDFASEEVGASNRPYRNAEAYGASRQQHWPYGNAFSQPYRWQHGGSMQPYQNVGTSHELYHNSWDNYRQGLPRGGFSRSRQSQEVRNL